MLHEKGPWQRLVRTRLTFQSMNKLLIFLLSLLGIPFTVFAADSGKSVVVIYNSLMPESKAVAEHYASRRQVPENQVLGLELPRTETMTRTEFRTDLQKPLFKWLEKQKFFTVRLESQTATNGLPEGMFWKVKDATVRYAVLCYGVPLRILEDASIKEPGVDKLVPQLRRNGAAVDSELCLLPVQDLKIPLSGPTQNPFYGVTNTTVLGPTNGLLLVARLDGPNAALARGLVDNAIKAENTGLWGRAYFDTRGLTNGTYQQGDDWFRKSAEICRQYGFETVVDQKPETFSAAFPMSHIAFYGGWYDNDVSGPFVRPSVEFAPGAFAYHLHSYSAASIRNPKQHWVGPLLEKGATITMGCVDEPYLALTPDIATFAARFIFMGFSYGEAAYAAQPVLSWQTTVIGDPLYRPFTKNPLQLHETLQRQNSKLIEWSHLGAVNINIVRGQPVDRVISYLQEMGKSSAVLTEKLGDVYQKEGKQSLAISAYAQALNLKPSLQQEIRLLLTLGEKLESANRTDEALNTYKLLLKLSPDYPDLASVNQKIISLADKLSKANEPSK